MFLPFHRRPETRKQGLGQLSQSGWLAFARHLHSRRRRRRRLVSYSTFFVSIFLAHFPIIVGRLQELVLPLSLPCTQKPLRLLLLREASGRDQIVDHRRDPRRARPRHKGFRVFESSS